MFRSDGWIADRNSEFYNSDSLFFLQKGPYKNQNFTIKPLKTCNQALYRDFDLKHPRHVHGFSHHRSSLSHRDPAIPKLGVYNTSCYQSQATNFTNLFLTFIFICYLDYQFILYIVVIYQFSSLSQSLHLTPISLYFYVLIRLLLLFILLHAISTPRLSIYLL